MSEEINPFKSLRTIDKYGPLYAGAKADRTNIENFLKVRKASLCQDSDGKTVSDRENYAYTHPDYLELLHGLKQAVEKEETYKFKLKTAELAISVYQTMSANSRLEAKSIETADKNG